MSLPPLLVFGYGNPSRGDDGLGPLLLQRLQAEELEGVECLIDFQLQVEHALDLEGRRLVLFVDAHGRCRAPFEFEPLQAARDSSYTSHAMNPAAVLQVYRDIKGHEPPPSFLLSIRGEDFDLGEPLSRAAREHLTAASNFALKLCARPEPEFWLILPRTGIGNSL